MIAVVIIVFILIIYYMSKQIKSYQNITSYKQAKDSGFIIDVLIKVISRDFASKKYTDIISLDGGTVGIAHFAVGGLASLYPFINCQKYFGKSESEMISKYSTLCKTNSCYNLGWWKQGFINFLNSPESKTQQNAAYINKVKGVVEYAIGKGWVTQRQLAIAIGISNSVGESGFKSLAEKNGLDAEKTLTAYVGSDAHRIRRQEAINKNYPLN